MVMFSKSVCGVVSGYVFLLKSLNIKIKIIKYEWFSFDNLCMFINLECFFNCSFIMYVLL